MEVQKCLHTFASWSGLQANPNKTGIYFGGVSEENIDNILRSSGFNKENFPFRYLGIPLSSSRLTITACAPLLDSISANLIHLSTHFLSYAGRLQLINSIIFGIINYWCTPFLLPAALLIEITKMCRRFFWNSEDKRHKMIFFGWTRICRPKSEGGLNIKELLSWNKSLICKLIFKLSIRKGAWEIWASDHFLPSTSIWEVIKCQSDSWAWKNLLNVRDYICEHADTNAIDLFRSWVSSDKFNVSRAYDFLRPKSTPCTWQKIVWNNAAVPKHSIISVLAIQNALPTYDNLVT